MTIRSEFSHIYAANDRLARFFRRALGFRDDVLRRAPLGRPIEMLGYALALAGAAAASRTTTLSLARCAELVLGREHLRIDWIRTVLFGEQP